MSGCNIMHFSKLFSYSSMETAIRLINRRSKGISRIVSLSKSMVFKIWKQKKVARGQNVEKRRPSLTPKFYQRHLDIVSKYNVGLQTLLLEGLSEPEFYGD